MKTIWNNLPAWLKATLLNIILLYPVIMINQLIVQINIQQETSIPWALPGVALILFIYWKIVSRFSRKSDQSEIRIECNLGRFGKAEWLKVLGITLIVFSLLVLTYGLLPVENSNQLQFISSFKQLEMVIAVPLLMALALSAGVVEEVTYRGFMQNVLQHKYSKFLSYIIIGILFSIAHLLPLNVVVTYIVVSMVFSFVADKEKSIAINIIAHFLVDFIIFLGIYFDLLQFSATNIPLMVACLLMLGIGYFMVSNSPKLSLNRA